MRSFGVYGLLFSYISSLPTKTVADFICSKANATPSSSNGADPYQIAETGCKIFGTCKRDLSNSAQLSARQGSLTCPAGFGCYYLVENGGLYCLSLDTWDLITADGGCGNVLTGTVYTCGQQTGAGSGGTGTSSGSGSGSGTGGSGGSGFGTGSGSGSGLGSGSDSGSGNGAGRPNEGGRIGLERGLLSCILTVLAANLMVL